MFLKSRSWMTNSGQYARGLFLMVVDHPTEKFERNGKSYSRLYALVRHIQMSQCGHFMMANAVVNKHEFVLSGSLVGDGLPLDYKKVAPIFHLFKPIPDDIAYIYWTDETGHNSVGVSGKDLHKWACSEKSIFTPQGWHNLHKKK